MLRVTIGRHGRGVEWFGTEGGRRGEYGAGRKQKNLGRSRGFRNARWSNPLSRRERPRLKPVRPSQWAAQDSNL